MSRPSGRRHLWPLAATVAALAMLQAGCSTAESNLGTAAPLSTQTITVGTRTAPTLTSTVVGTVTASPPESTVEPPAVDGGCPYLDDTTVAEINGQRAGTTQIIEVSPYPICVFSRNDGEWMASVRIIEAATPESAVAAVNDHVPIDGSDPASQPAGWVGGSMVTPSGSVYAVSKGNIAIVAESNQQQSIKGRQLVVQSVTNLGL